MRITEVEHVNLEGGYLVDGFPSVGQSSAIASESMLHTGDYKVAAVIDSDAMPPISVVRGGRPSHPTRVLANEEHRVGVFMSYLNLNQTFHKAAARAMLDWARDHGIGLVVSSVAVQSESDGRIICIGNTDSARRKAKEAGMDILENGTVPGIPGALLNMGGITGQDVIVIMFHTDGKGPDFVSGAHLCMAMSKLIPGVSCDIKALEREAQKAQDILKGAEEESRHLRDTMYG